MIVHPHPLQLQHHVGQVDLQYLRRGPFLQGIVGEFGVEAETYPRGDASRPSGPLGRLGLAEGGYGEAFHSRGAAGEIAPFVLARIDDVAYSVEGDGCFGYVGGEDDLAGDVGGFWLEGEDLGVGGRDA